MELAQQFVEAGPGTKSTVLQVIGAGAFFRQALTLSLLAEVDLALQVLGKAQHFVGHRFGARGVVIGASSCLV